MLPFAGVVLTADTDVGATVDDTNTEAELDEDKVVTRAVVVAVVAAGAVVDAALVLVAGLAVLSKQSQALETWAALSLPTQSGRVLTDPARNFGQKAAASLA